ncbi:MAG: ATP-binding protein [Aquabacterium sp.]|nr:MAG: ATP-binding protein [Aquabacterium sp.]
MERPTQHQAPARQHLLAELERIDLLVRLQVAGARRVVARDAQFRGLYLGEAEVDALLQRPCGAPAWPTAQPQAAAALQPLRDRNRALADAGLAAGADLRLPRLQRAFGLDDFECDVLLLCLAPEIDLRYERLYAWLQDDVTRKRPGVALVLDLLAADLQVRLDLRARFEAGAALRRLRLVELADDAGHAPSTLSAKALKLDERMAAFLLGGDEPDERLRVACRVLRDGLPLDELQLHAQELQALRAVAARVCDAARPGPPLLLHLRGPRGAGKLEAAASLARELGRPLLQVDLAQLAGDAPQDFDGGWRLALREAGLQDALPCCTGFEGLTEVQRDALLQALSDFAAHGGGSPVCCLLSQQAWEPAGAWRGVPHAQVALSLPDAAQRGQLWRSALPAMDENIDREALASSFRLGRAQIRDAAATLLRWQEHRGAGWQRARLHEACRVHAHHRLSSVARKVEPRYGWHDIVLPEDRMAVLREICNHVTYRGRVWGEWGFDRKLAMGKGLAVLFAGPSGTGKTMAAEVLAAELGLDLYKIDLASVISKYIGETEKNLGRVFDEAESSGAILFFDEADALFGRRSEVRDSHDRYANVEVGYLLQRLESFEGMTILATNFRKNMDEAFVRRLQFSLDFPFPDAADRRRIWDSVWPDALPRDAQVDAAELARRFEMTGGNIRNVALAAAFMAADDGQRVRLEHVLRATRREYQKMGKLVDDGFFTPPPAHSGAGTGAALHAPRPFD